MISRSVVYVDTSALGALLIDQPESLILVDWLDHTTATLVSSDLLETELRRLAVREGLDQADVTRILDALHLDAALRLDADAILTYDHRLGDAAQSVGVDVTAPGNRLEPLVGDRSGQHGICVNARWRICFVWRDEGADDVELVDDH